jgi:hypothetical protein
MMMTRWNARVCAEDLRSSFALPDSPVNEGKSLLG